MALPNVSKFFLHQALEERKAAEALMKYQQERGGHYCSKTIQVGTRQQAFKQLQSVVITLLALYCWYFRSLHSSTIRLSDIIFLSYYCMWFCSWLWCLETVRYTVLTLHGYFPAQKNMNNGPLLLSLSWRLLLPVCCNGLWDSLNCAETAYLSPSHWN